MNRFFRRETYGVVVTAIAAWISYRAGIEYLPSLFLIVAGILMSGVFAELEDEALKKFDEHSAGSHDWHLLLLRFFRAVVLLSIGVLIFAMLGLQF